MNKIEDIPLTIVGQVVEGLIFTLLGLEAKPLKIDLPPACFKDADWKTRAYVDEILSAIESHQRLPVPNVAWKMHIYETLAALMKQRIKECLTADGVPWDDRIGRIVASYVKQTEPDGTFHDYLRYGALKPSKFGFAWFARLVHESMPALLRTPLNPTGKVWLRAFELNSQARRAEHPDAISGIPI